MSFVADLSALVEASSDERLRCPSEWKRAPLGSVAHVVNGFPFSSAAFGGTGAPVIRIRDVARGSTDTRYAGPVPDGYWIERGDLLIGMDGDFTSAFWRSDRALLNQRVCKVIPNPDALDSRYLAYILPAYLQLINENTPSVTVKHLSSRTLASIPIPLPDIAVQHRIADRIDELFTEVDDGEVALERARGDLTTWRKALLKAAVTGELTADWRAANPPTETGADLLARILAERRTRWLAEPRNTGKRYVEPERPNTSDLADLPKGWTWSSVAQLGNVTGGVTKNAKRDAHPLRLPYLRVGNVYEGRLDLTRIESIGLAESEVTRIALVEGDLLIVEGNGSIDQIGRCAVWERAIEPCVHQNHLIKFRPAARLFSDFVQTWLSSLAGRKELEERASSTSGLHTLSISKVEALRCPLPPLIEISEILDRLSTALASCSDAGAEQDEIVAGSATLRQSILAAAFRGDLVA